MLQYPKQQIYPKKLYKNDDRFIPFVPFLTGALVGGAAVGLTRPRPIYNVNPYPNYGPYPYYNNSYSYYVPFYR